MGKLICIKQWVRKQPEGASQEFIPRGGHSAALSGFIAACITGTDHKNKHTNLTSTQIVLKLSVKLSLFSFNAFIFMVAAELGYISLYLSQPCSCCIHTSLHKQCSQGLRPACSVAQMWWMAARGWHCLVMDGGESMLMDHCFKAFTCRNLQRRGSLSLQRHQFITTQKFRVRK